jgi:hypothetical protein
MSGLGHSARGASGGAARGRAFRYWIDHPKVAALILAAAAVITGLVALYNAREIAKLRDHGLFADGVVVEVHDGRWAEVVVGFETDDGQQVQAPVRDYRWDPPPRVGDAARVLYDPENAIDSARDTRVPLDTGGPWLLGGLSVALLGAGIAAWNGRLRWLVRSTEPEEDGLGWR